MAILAVVAFHYLSETPLWPVTNWGWAGVDLFFVLSGFLITGILLDAKGGERYFRNFYARRFLRIFPLYYLVVLLGWLFYPRIDGARAAQLALYVQNIYTGIENWPYGHFGHFWTLAVEEQFYLVWPAIVYATSGRSLARFCIAAIAVAWVLRLAAVLTGHGEMAYVLLPTRMDTLAAGGLLAIGVRVRPQTTALLVTWIGLAGVVGLAAHLAASRSFDPPLELWALTSITAIASWICHAAHQAPAGLYSMSWLRWAGRHAYGLYVVHPFVWVILQSWVPNYPRIALATALSLTAAWASYRYYERPFLELKRKFPYRRVEPDAERNRQPSLPEVG